MLEAVSFLGQLLNTGEEMIAGLVKDIPVAPKSPKFLVKLNFEVSREGKRLDAKMAEIPEDEQTRRAFLARWRWVGNASGNNPQLFLTTDKPEYLLKGEAHKLKKLAPLALLNELEKRGERGELYRKLSLLLDTFFIRQPDGSYLLDWGDGKAKEVQEVVNALLKMLGLSKKKVALWTVLFNGKPLVEVSPYDEVVLSYMQKSFEGEEVSEGPCSVCGREREKVTFSAFERLGFLKYYITDKLGAASRLTKQGFAKNFLICQPCFQNLMLAEKFMQNDLAFRVGELDFLVLPAFLLFPQGVSRQELLLGVEKLKRRVTGLANTASLLEGIAGSRGLEEELQNILDELPFENQALLNFLFYRKAQSEFRIFALIKDVAPSRISHLIKRSNVLQRKAKDLLDRECWIDLTRIYYLIPLRTGNQVEQKKVIYIYEGLVRRQPVSYHFLIQQFVHLAKTYIHDNFEGTNIRRPHDVETSLAQKIMEAGFLLKLFREENILKGVRNLDKVDPLDFISLEIDEKILGYLKEMDYSPAEAALFLLGYLINEVGRGQFAAGHRDKPVLEKINYQGMPWPRVRQLANLLFEKLRQYNRLPYTEKLYAQMKKLLDAYRESWPLSPEENVFYILSGYSYGTLTTRTRKEEGEEE